MSGFGDFDDDDAIDDAPPDPEQVARKLHAIRYARGRELETWDDQSELERVTAVTIVTALLAWLRRQGAIR